MADDAARADAYDDPMSQRLLDVEAGALADHRDLDHLVDEGPRFLRDAVALMAEQHHGPGPGRLEAGKRGGVLSELDADDDAAVPLPRDPGELGPVEPVDVRPTRERVAVGERRPVVLGVRHGHAGTDGIAGAQQRAEVRAVRDPQRRDDEVIPAAVLAAPAAAAEILRPGLRPGGHRPGEQLLEVTMCGALGGGA